MTTKKTQKTKVAENNFVLKQAEKTRKDSEQFVKTP